MRRACSPDIAASPPDITERKLAEIERENNEALLLAVVDNLPVALLVKDVEGRNTMLNKTFREWYGVTNEQALGRINIGLHGEGVSDSEVIEEQERFVIDTGQTIGRETVRRLADGKDHYIAINKYPIHDRQDSVQGVVSVSVDLTDRIQASQALTESEARFREFAEIASDWLWEMDEDLRFTYVSSRYTEITGINVAESLGKTRLELSAEDTSTEAWQKHLDDLAKRRPFRDFRYRGQNPMGQDLTFSVSGNPFFDAAGQFRGYRGTTTDVTRDEELNRMKSEFVSTASHELRTPLTSIHAALRLIASGALGAARENQRPD